jgi:hypothetical protein
MDCWTTVETVRNLLNRHFKRLTPVLCSCVVFGMVFGSAFACRGQTNLLSPEMRWFVLPAPRLRVIVTEPAKPDTPPPKVSLAVAPTKVDSTAAKVQTPFSFSADVGSDEEDFSSRYRGFVLKPLPQQGLIGRLNEGFESVFSPEEFRVGRTAKVSCTLLTAIKRKDPLCLLNPIFFNFSW